MGRPKSIILTASELKDAVKDTKASIKEAKAKIAELVKAQKSKQKDLKAAIVEAQKALATAEKDHAKELRAAEADLNVLHAKAEKLASTTPTENPPKAKARATATS